MVRKSRAMPDKRKVTSPQNGRKGGGQPGMRPQTRERLKAIQRTAELDAEVVIEQIARGALYDPRNLFDQQGNIKPIHKLTEAEASCIAGFEIVLKNAAAGDGVVDRVLKVKLTDRAKYVEMAAKYHSLLVDKVEVDVNVQLVGSKLDKARLAAARRNVPKRLAEGAIDAVVVEPQKTEKVKP